MMYVVITSNGIVIYDPKLDEAEVLATFPEDVNIVAKAMHKAYAPMIDAEVLEEALYKLIEYLKRHDAYLYEGDLVRIENGKLYGLKTLPEVAEELQEIFGPEAEVLLTIFLQITNDFKKRAKQ